MFSELTFMRAEMVKSNASICHALNKAALQANETLKEHVAAHPETSGMGATLVSTVIVDGKLYWISIGDSPLFLFRDNALLQLNEDHSMSRTIDMMVQSGMLSAEDGEDHPDRNVLTSALFGEPIPEIDCPSKPIQLRAGDTLIVASDGLQFLTNAEIEKLLRDRPISRSSDVADALMSSLKNLKDPDLDNVSMSVIQVKLSQESTLGLRSEHQKGVLETPKSSLFQKMFKPQGVDSETVDKAHE
jgi:serine/threonine protein phosphatase PrpC